MQPGSCAMQCFCPKIILLYLTMTVLQGKCLDLGTAKELISASKVVDWTDLEPALLRMTQPVTYLWDPLNKCIAMAEAAILLLGLLLAISAVHYALCNYSPIILLCHQVSVMHTAPVVQ